MSKKSPDIFGLTIYKYWKTNNNIKIKFLRDDGLKFEFSPKRFFTVYKDFPQLEKLLLKNVKGKILDVGCGVGRHVLYLQNEGYNVVGIDSSKYLIKIAKERGCKQCCLQDIYSFNPREKFDTILLLGNNIGIAKSVKGAYRLFKKLRQLLNPKGVIIATSIDYERTSDKFFERYILFNKTKNKDKGQLVTKNIFGNKTTRWLKWLYLTPKELENICDHVGLYVKRCYHTSDGSYGIIISKI